jgi:small-conductance mechanosensitive channel
MFAVAFGAIFIGIAAGLGFGSKDVFHNLIGQVQTSQSMKVGQRVKVEDVEGTVSSINRYHVVIKTATGDVHMPHSNLAKAVVVVRT